MLLKSARQHFYPIFPLLLDELSWKSSALVTSQTFGIFFNILTAYHMFCLQNWEKWPQQVQTSFSLKLKTFSEIFIAFLKSTSNFAHFEENDQLHSLIIWPRSIWLPECLKGLVSEHSSTVNVLAHPKRCWNHNGNVFILTFCYSQTNWVGKHLSYRYVKS